MGLLDQITAGRLVTETSTFETAGRAQLVEQLEISEANQELLTEALADLEQSLHDDGWIRLTAQADQEFSPEGLKRIREISRVMVVANPLMKRAVNLRTAYIWGGEGPQIAARATGEDGLQDVNAVVQAFLDDAGNRRALTGATARQLTERGLATDGERFIACFTDPRDGVVQARVLTTDEITDVYSNPQDSSDPWFYRRRFVTTAADEGTLAGLTRAGVRTVDELYPALGFIPEDHGVRRPSHIDGIPVLWDAPVRHVKINALDNWERGIGDLYASIPWARLYQEFLVDWAKLVKALSRFAFKMSADRKGKAEQMAARAKQAAPRAARTGEPMDVGGTAVMGPNQNLEAVGKSGATIDSESGKPLASMIAAGLDVPVTMMLTDPGVTGARATAETLEKPTEFMANLRRGIHTEWLTDILTYVIAQAVKAPGGPLQGDRRTGELPDPAENTLDITWPDLTSDSVKDQVEAIVQADSTGKLPALTVVRLLLEALGVGDVDELLDAMTDEHGQFIDPQIAAAAAAIAKQRKAA